jgi:hypothetical protein
MNATISTVTFFPSMASDETVYSACARFHERAGYSNPRITSSVLLGHPGGAARPDAVSGLSHLEVASGGVVAANVETIYERTVLGPFLSLLDDARRRTAIRACMATAIPGPTRAQLGLSWASGFYGHELRACPECLFERYQNRKFLYWRTMHQLAGVWICPIHDCLLHYVDSPKTPKAAGWATPAVSRFVPPPCCTSSDKALLAKLAACSMWLAAARQVNVHVLATVVRSRLRHCGAIRSETRVRKDEFESILKDLVEPIAALPGGRFGGLRSSDWLRITLHDKRTVHPLNWIALLCISGETKPQALTAALYEAQSRTPQPSLFDDKPRWTDAPFALYEALSGPSTVQAAARASGYTPGEIERWLRRDEKLRLHWRSASDAVKSKAAINVLLGALHAVPDARRVALANRCKWATSWLASRQPDILEELLPPPYGQRGDLFS